MRSFSSILQNALLDREIVFRDFLWIIAKDRVTGNPVPAGLWSDVGNISAQVINPQSGSAVTRNFEGAGALVEISDIPAVNNLSVQTVTVNLSQIAPRVEELIRLYDVKLATVQIFSGYFDPSSRQLIEPALCRWHGFVDSVEINTPSENNPGRAVLNCVSHTQELTRANAETRSHDSQQIRAPGDGFFRDAAAVGEWNVDWGQYSKQGGAVSSGHGRHADNAFGVLGRIA